MAGKLQRLTRRRFSAEHVDVMIDEILDIVSRQLAAGFRASVNEEIDAYVKRMQNRDRDRHIK
jgi:hypothetical protein